MIAGMSTTPALTLHKQKFEATAKIADLVDHPRNPRRGDDLAVGASVEANGFYGAIVAQRSTGYILAGHTRRRAPPPRTGQTTGPVLWLDVDDATANRILVADNRTAELAHWDDSALLALLNEMTNSELGLAGLGFTGDDLTSLVARTGQDLDDYPPIDEGEDGDEEVNRKPVECPQCHHLFLP